MKCRVFYPNGDEELLDLSNSPYIFRVLNDSKNSIVIKSILNKVGSLKDNGLINKGYGRHPLYHSHDPINGVYRQCGGAKRNTAWTTGDFLLTVNPNQHQFEDKVVMSYIRKPRAQFFSSEDAVGVVCAPYWLTSNSCLTTLLNSKLLEKLKIAVTPLNEKHYPGWLLKSLNFEGLTAQTEEELYLHYGLTDEEIDWIKNN